MERQEILYLNLSVILMLQVAGNDDGITAFQMDIKVINLTRLNEFFLFRVSLGVFMYLFLIH